MGWCAILMITLFGVVAGTFWFVTITDIVERIKYRHSKYITDRGQNKKDNYYPEPNSMHIIEIDKGDYAKSNDSCNSSSQSSPFILGHIEHIIKRLKSCCQRRG